MVYIVYKFQEFSPENIIIKGNSLVVQWLGLCAFTEGEGSIPGRGTKIPQAVQCSHKYIHTYIHTHIHTYIKHRYLKKKRIKVRGRIRF